MNAETDPRTGGSFCPAPEELLDALTGESAQDRTDIARHLASCDSCRTLVEELRRTMEDIRVLDKPEEPVDLVAGILARIPEHAWTSRGRRDTSSWPTWIAVPLKLAAAIILFLGVSTVCWRTMQQRAIAPQTAGQGSRMAGVQRGLSWLAANQNPYGGWSVEDLGGKVEYATALSGLAALALARNPAGIQNGDPVLRKVGVFLVAQQEEDGRFGPDIDGTMYNQGIATLAMLEIYRLTQDHTLRQPISDALAFICSRQTPSGGWGYNTTAKSNPNTSITAWQVQALLSASQQGWDENGGALRRGLGWMTRTVDDRGFFGYEQPRKSPDGPGTLTMMGAYCVLSAQRDNVPIDAAVLGAIKRGVAALAGEKPDDCYGTYFYAAALTEASGSQFADTLEALRRPLLASQTTDGKDSGSWPANDRWQSVGGRLYSTSLSLLSL